MRGVRGGGRLCGCGRRRSGGGRRRRVRGRRRRIAGGRVRRGRVGCRVASGRRVVAGLLRVVGGVRVGCGIGAICGCRVASVCPRGVTVRAGLRVVVLRAPAVARGRAAPARVPAAVSAAAARVVVPTAAARTVVGRIPGHGVGIARTGTVLRTHATAAATAASVSALGSLDVDPAREAQGRKTRSRGAAQPQSVMRGEREDEAARGCQGAVRMSKGGASDCD